MVPRPLDCAAVFFGCLVALVLPTALPVSAAGSEGAASRAGEDWWSLNPLSRPPLPPTRNVRWARNPIDAFVLARLESDGLSPAPEADRVALVRRLSYDLIGLPPAPELTRDFVGDRSPRAYERLVEQLLSSPHYGERWGRHWLDVARYGESDGFEYDRLRPTAWPYRDWVIEALNDDMPYDEFARRQIAGDVISPEDPSAAVATGFLVCGAFDGLTPKGDKMRAIMRQDELEDLVGTVAQAFLGLTVHCARCHDHKFDPIQQREYYQISAALAGVRRGERRLDPYSETRRALKEKAFAPLRALERPVRLAAARAVSNAEPPRPLASWSFDGHALDTIGGLDGDLEGTARIRDGRLELDGEAGRLRTLRLEQDIREKTVEAWVSCDDLQQPGGGVMGLQRVSGSRGDAIVFEGEAAGTAAAQKETFPRWVLWRSGTEMPETFGGAAESRSGEVVHVAFVYESDGTVRAYRNGTPYGASRKMKEPRLFGARSQVVFGRRNGTSPKEGRTFRGRIHHANLYDRALTTDEVRASAAFHRLDADDVASRLDAAARREHARLRRLVPSLADELVGYRPINAYVVTPKPPPAVHLLERGSPSQPGEEVVAGGVASIQGPSSDFGLTQETPEGERRRALAEWVADDSNPLFARTIANRLWHYHFGRGFVETPSDLGFSGGVPSHPELLEWLAVEVRESGWSLKHVHRLILTSATYRQSSRLDVEAARRDADNRTLWRFNPRRLEAEVLRDSLLTVAGRLNRRMGGKGFADFDSFKDRGTWSYPAVDRDLYDAHRRSVYRTWARGAKSPLLDAFDCPDPSVPTPKRGVTSTPLGALTLLNNVFVLRMADSFAERLREDVGRTDSRAQISRAFELAFSRAPLAEEIDLSTKFIADESLEAWCRIVLNTNEFLYVP